jgi:anti-anti-sigma factor
MSNHFNVHDVRSGDTTTVVCAGELDIATMPSVEKLIQEVLGSDPPKTLELDWSGLTFMDSTGIRLLLMIVKQSAAQGVDLLWRLSPPAQRALDAVGIHDGLLRQLGEGAGPRSIP